MDRVILHIDMNSYFATVEQQSNPLLRGKPIAVSGRPSIHSVVATASYEAKAFGVRAGMSTWEAKKLCPNLIFIPGDPNKYIDITGRLIKIFKSYSPLMEIFSVDEVFLQLFNEEDPKKVALEIKSRIKEEIGDKMTCSIGIASNKFLAKLASEKKKPDGLTVIFKGNLDQMLLDSQLIDFCGLGRQTLKKLESIGIYTVEQLRTVPVETLISVFGNATGRMLHNMSFGIDDSPVTPDFETEEQKSFSHSLTLDKATDNTHYVEAVMLRLCEKVARRMRMENFCAKVVSIFIRLPDRDGFSEQKMLSYYIDDGLEIFKIGREMLNPTEMLEVNTVKKLPFKVRMISVGVGRLVKKGIVTESLLPEKQRAEKIVTSMDFANDRFGENSVFRAATLSAFDREKSVAGIRIRLRFQ